MNNSFKFERLRLEEAQDNNPQIRSLLHLFEEDAEKLKEFSKEFQSGCQRIYKAYLEVSEALRNLSSIVMKMDSMYFPLDRDDGKLKAITTKFTDHLNKRARDETERASKIGDAMLPPINRLLSGDFEDVSRLSGQLNLVSEAEEQSLDTYMRLSKKAPDSVLNETGHDVGGLRRQRHLLTVRYFASLNCLQPRRYSSILSAMTGLLIIGTNDQALRDFLAASDDTVQELERLPQTEKRLAEELSARLAISSASVYSPSRPLASRPGTKAGYLCWRTRGGILPIKRWYRSYFFTQAGNLMHQDRDQVAGSLLFDLNEDGLYVELAECDDRRNLFQIVSAAQKKTIVFQAENEPDCKDWVDTVIRITRDEGYVRFSGAGLAVNQCEVVGLETWLDSQPIQFDLSGCYGDAGRHNPFDSSSPGGVYVRKPSDILDFRPLGNFLVRFLGSVRVPEELGIDLITRVIRRMVAARAAHDLFRLAEAELVVSAGGIALLQPESGDLHIAFALEELEMWGPHRENDRYFGVLTRSPVDETSQEEVVHMCYAFECDSGQEIASVLRSARRVADPNKSKETELLLANIALLPDLNSPTDVDEAEEVTEETDEQHTADATDEKEVETKEQHEPESEA